MGGWESAIPAIGSIAGAGLGNMGGGSSSFSTSGGDSFTNYANQTAQYGYGQNTGRPKWKEQRQGLREMYGGVRDLMGQTIPEVGSVAELVASLSPDTLQGFSDIRGLGDYLRNNIGGYMNDTGKTVQYAGDYLGQKGDYLQGNVANELASGNQRLGQSQNFLDTYLKGRLNQAGQYTDQMGNQITGDVSNQLNTSRGQLGNVQNYLDRDVLSQLQNVYGKQAEAGNYLRNDTASGLRGYQNAVGNAGQFLEGGLTDALGRTRTATDAAGNALGASQGYLGGALSNELNKFKGTDVNENDVYGSTKGYAQDVIGGKYLDPTQNTALQNYLDINYERTLGKTNALANQYGAFGGSDWALQREKAGRELAADTYQSERARQQEAAQSFLPQLQQYKQNIKGAAGQDLAATQQQYQNYLNQFGAQSQQAQNVLNQYGAEMNMYGAKGQQAQMQNQNYANLLNQYGALSNDVNQARDVYGDTMGYSEAQARQFERQRELYGDEATKYGLMNQQQQALLNQYGAGSNYQNQLLNQYQAGRGQYADTMGYYDAMGRQYADIGNQYGMERAHLGDMRQQYQDETAQAQNLVNIGYAQQGQNQRELDAARYLLQYPVNSQRNALNWAQGLLTPSTGTLQDQTNQSLGWNSGWSQTRQAPNVSKSSGGK